MDILKFYLNNTANLHPLTPRIVPSYGGSIVTIDSVTSIRRTYVYRTINTAQSPKRVIRFKLYA